MRKMAVSLLILIVILVVFTSIKIYNNQSIPIQKNLNMVSLNDFFKNNQGVETGQNSHKFQVNLFLNFHKNIFKDNYYTGTITINDEYEYKVVSTTIIGDAHHLVFINNRDPFNYANIEFSLLEKNQFDSVVINNIEINGSEYLLAGPATTVQDAEKKLTEFYPPPDN